MPCLISTGGHLLEFRKFPSRFGTYAENELVVQEGMGVAAHHFTLRREGVRIVLETTGEGVTTVNGNNIRRANIRDGDRIQVGQLMLIYSNPSGQQNHHPGRLDPGGPIALPSPTVEALPSPTNASPPVVVAASPSQTSTPRPADSPHLTAQAEENRATAFPVLGNAHPNIEQTPESSMDPGAFLVGNHTQRVPEGIPKDSETTPSESFLAWAKAAELENESPITASVSAAISAQSAASTPTLPSVRAPVQDQQVHRATAAQASHPSTRSFPTCQQPSTANHPVTPSQAPPQTAPSNPFAEAALQAQPATLANQQPPPVETVGNAAEHDLAAVFLDPEPEPESSQADEGDDLASFFQDDHDGVDESPITPEPRTIAEIPEIPNISDAEKVGATAKAPAPPSKDINPIGSILNKGKPLPSPPPPAAPVDVKASESANKFSPLADRKSARQRKSKHNQVESSDSMAGRLTNSKLQPKYRLQIPWHKVAIFLCLIFAGAGAYLATSGQAHVDRYMTMMGLKSDPAHHMYLTRFADLQPNMILTADADKIVEFYRKWASEANWMTVGDLEDKLKNWATKIRLSNLEHVSVATNDEGNFVALVSTKSNLNRQDLMRDLGQGVLAFKRYGQVKIHDGFVSKSTPVNFAILNPKTMVIGDPDMVMQFVKAPATPNDAFSRKHPATSLANSPKDLLGLYHTRNGLETLSNWFSGPLKPTLDRFLGFIHTDATEESEFLAQIGGDLRVNATFSFDETESAEAFASSFRMRASRQLGIFMDLLGPTAPRSFDGAAKDLEQVAITTPGNKAKLALSTTNRWATLGSIELKDALFHLVASLEKRPIEQTPSLLSPEEMRARALAQEIIEKCSVAMKMANTKSIFPGQDVAEVISLMSKGVRGSGVYHRAQYRVDDADRMRGRLLQLLEWRGDELVMVVKDPPPLDADGPSMAIQEEGEEGETNL